MAFRRFIICIGLSFGIFHSTASAQQDISGKTELPNTGQSVPSDAIPQPQAALQSLMDRGRVRFVTGGLPQSDFRTIPNRGKLAGETRFKFRFEYSSRLRWFQRRGSRASESNQPMVRIRVRFGKLKFIVSHEVWLLDVPPPDRFWNDPVVLHELDHVRISSDPRIERQFIDAAKASSSFEVPLSSVADASGIVKESAIRNAVDQRLQEILGSVTDYAQVRYRELDRLTLHGLRALPSDSQLFVKPEGTSDR